jgi:hypothetical protein
MNKKQPLNGSQGGSREHTLKHDRIWRLDPYKA